MSLGWLLDTCVLSEAIRPQPHPAVVAALSALPDGQAAVSVVTFGEIRQGIIALPEGRRRDALTSWEAELRHAFTGRILAVDLAVMECWAVAVAARQRQGRPLLGNDAYLAATAARHDLMLVTRNTDDFEGLGLRMLNPWAAA